MSTQAKVAVLFRVTRHRKKSLGPNRDQYGEAMEIVARAAGKNVVRRDKTECPRHHKALCTRGATSAGT